MLSKSQYKNFVFSAQQSGNFDLMNRIIQRKIFRLDFLVIFSFFPHLRNIFKIMNELKIFWEEIRDKKMKLIFYIFILFFSTSQK
jgi:hypothetical protein